MQSNRVYISRVLCVFLAEWARKECNEESQSVTSNNGFRSNIFTGLKTLAIYLVPQKRGLGMPYLNGVWKKNSWECEHVWSHWIPLVHSSKLSLGLQWTPVQWPNESSPNDHPPIDGINIKPGLNKPFTVTNWGVPFIKGNITIVGIYPYFP